MKASTGQGHLFQKNKKAFFNYEIVDVLECGIVLEGTEVKSIRAGKFSFGDAFVRIKGNEIFLVGMHISLYVFGNIHNHDPLRERKLLASSQEIKLLKRKVEEKGFTLVPTALYGKKNLIKVEIGLARGKKLHDKRNAIKERDIAKEAQRQAKDDY